MLALARIMCANIHSQNGTAILAQELLFTQARKFESFSFYPLDLCYRHVWCTSELWSRHSWWGDSGSDACGGTNNFGFGKHGLLSTCGRLWTPRIGKWLRRWWKTRTMLRLRPTSCRVSMSSILRVQLPNLQDSIDTMMATMEKMKLGSTADGVEAPSRPEGVASAAAVPLRMRHLWMTRSWSRPHTSGRSLAGAPHPLPSSWQRSLSPWRRWPRTSSWWWTSWALRRSMTCLSSFCDSESIPAVSFGRVVKAYVAMKAQKVHDEVMKQPHVAGRSRPGVGSDSLRENTQPEPIATHQCPECFTDWATQWDPSKEKMCVCGKKVLPIKKTKHLVNMDHPTGNWLLFMTGNGITWVRDGKSEADAASASGDGSSKSDKDFKLRHAVDIGMLAEAPLCPADHAETSLSDFVLSKDRLQLRTEVLNRVVDAETFPSEAPSRPQNSKDCKKDQAALVFHPDAAAAMALAGKLTGADVPPEEAFHPKRPEAEMLKVVQDNADILHDMQSGAMSVEDPQGAEALRHLDMVKFKEVLKRKFLEGPGSNQSAWLSTGAWWTWTRRRPRTVSMSKPGGLTSSSWRHHLGTHPFGERSCSSWSRLDSFARWLACGNPAQSWTSPMPLGSMSKAKHMIAELRQQAYPKLLTEVATMPAGHACGHRDPRQVLSHQSQKIGARISWGQGGPSSPIYDQHVRWWDPAARWQVEEIWVHGCPNLVQATPTSLGSCAGLGTPHTPHGSRPQLRGVPPCTLGLRP